MINFYSPFLNNTIYVGGIESNIDKLSFFSRKNAIATTKKLLNKFFFLSKFFYYACTFIDVPGFNGIMCLSYSKKNYPEIKVSIESKCTEILINVENEYISVPMLYYVYNHNEPIRTNINGNENYQEDFRKYLKFLLDNNKKLSKSEFDSFYAKNPAYKIKWLS